MVRLTWPSSRLGIRLRNELLSPSDGQVDEAQNLNWPKTLQLICVDRVRRLSSPSVSTQVLPSSR